MDGKSPEKAAKKSNFMFGRKMLWKFCEINVIMTKVGPGGRMGPGRSNSGPILGMENINGTEFCTENAMGRGVLTRNWTKT